MDLPTRRHGKEAQCALAKIRMNVFLYVCVRVRGVDTSVYVRARLGRLWCVRVRGHVCVCACVSV